MKNNNRNAYQNYENYNNNNIIKIIKHIKPIQICVTVKNLKLSLAYYCDNRVVNQILIGLSFISLPLISSRFSGFWTIWLFISPTQYLTPPKRGPMTWLVAFLERWEGVWRGEGGPHLPADRQSGFSLKRGDAHSLSLRPQRSLVLLKSPFL